MSSQCSGTTSPGEPGTPDHHSMWSGERGTLPAPSVPWSSQVSLPGTHQVRVGGSEGEASALGLQVGFLMDVASGRRGQLYDLVVLQTRVRACRL